MSVKYNGYTDFPAALRRALVLVQVGMIIGSITTWAVNWWLTLELHWKIERELRQVGPGPPPDGGDGSLAHGASAASIAPLPYLSAALYTRISQRGAVHAAYEI